MSGQIDMNGQKITGLGEPGNGKDAVPKDYMDSSFRDFKPVVSHQWYLTSLRR